MKILMIRWKSICEPDMIAAFRACGHEVVEWAHTIQDPDYDTDAIQKLSDTLLGERYDLVFTVDYFPIVARVCNAVGVRYASWSVDCPVVQYYSETIELPCNRIFLFDYMMYEEFAPYNPNCIFYLPLGASISHNDEVISSITEQDRDKYSCDISFIGSTYEEKCRFNELGGLSEYARGYADAMIESQLRVYGYNFLEDAMRDRFVVQFKNDADWGGINPDYRMNDRAVIAQMYVGEKVTEQERLRLLARLSQKFSIDMYTQSDLSHLPKLNYRGCAESRVEMPKIFHLSKINLNMTSKTIRTGLPQRFWDVLGAGGFLLSNMQAELPEFLTPGVDVETYGSFEECEAKIAYYLEHDEERGQIAQNGYEKVKQCYSYEQRVQQMMQMV
jgi:spore maturation protein CgeB